MPYRICWYCFHFGSLKDFRWEKAAKVWLCEDIKACIDRGNKPKAVQRRTDRVNRINRDRRG